MFPPQVVQSTMWKRPTIDHTVQHLVNSLQDGPWKDAIKANMAYVRDEMIELLRHMNPGGADFCLLRESGERRNKIVQRNLEKGSYENHRE